MPGAGGVEVPSLSQIFGVVEVQKNWTLTPPWVNNYAPIN
jgi:hypothetical protein